MYEKYKSVRVTENNSEEEYRFVDYFFYSYFENETEFSITGRRDIFRKIPGYKHRWAHQTENLGKWIDKEDFEAFYISLGGEIDNIILKEETVNIEDVDWMPGDNFNDGYWYFKVTGKLLTEEQVKELNL